MTTVDLDTHRHQAFSSNVKLELSVEWRPIVSSTLPSQHGTPLGRWKQAVVLYRGWLYVQGGRCGRQPLKDLWRWREGVGWQQLTLLGAPPPPLEGHTILAHNSHLYIFGGTYGGYPVCPLWVIGLQSCLSRQWSASNDVMQPGSRRNHSAVLYHTAMYMFGGVADVRGASNDFWAFDLPTESWHLVWSPNTHSSSGPTPRFGHSACIHDGHMWIFGGYNDLRLSPNDLWRWSFRIGQWCRVRFTSGPTSMAYHACTTVRDSMLVFGGEGKDAGYTQLWVFSFVTLSWTAVNQKGIPNKPSGTSHHSLVALNAMDMGFMLSDRIPGHFFSEPTLPRTVVQHLPHRPSTSLQTSRFQPQPQNSNIHPHTKQPPSFSFLQRSSNSTPADSGFSETGSVFRPISEEPELRLEDIEDCADLFSQSSASLISTISLGSFSNPSERLPSCVDKRANVSSWAFNNESLSVSSFGSINNDSVEDETYEEEMYNLEPQHYDPSQVTMYCLGAFENGVEARSLIIWQGCVSNL